MSMWLRAVCLAVAVSSSTTTWGITLVTDPSDFTANVVTDFESVAPPSTQTPQPFVYTDSGGLQVTLSSSDASAFLNINPNPTFSRDFLPGQVQVFSSQADTLNITFSQAVQAVATQITHPHQGSYLSRITAYDASNNVLGTFQRTGIENNSGDGSAIWIGVEDTSATIARITLENFEGTTIVQSPSNQDTVLITDLRIQTASTPGGQNPPPIPEPGSVALLAISVAALACRLRRA